MCKLNLIFSKAELKGVRKRHRAALEKDAIRQIRKSRQLQKIILGDKGIRKMIREKPSTKLRAALRGKLRRKVFKLSEF
jgi:hypothetical protein